VEGAHVLVEPAPREERPLRLDRLRDPIAAAQAAEHGQRMPRWSRTRRENAWNDSASSGAVRVVAHEPPTEARERLARARAVQRLRAHGRALEEGERGLDRVWLGPETSTRKARVEKKSSRSSRLEAPTSTTTTSPSRRLS